jgi:hypothetical protein
MLLLKRRCQVKDEDTVPAKANIPPYAILIIIMLLSIGEFLSGTSAIFVTLMAATLSCIAVTYNLLGGLRTFTGLLFSAFSLRTIVISQVAKVLFFETADKNLEAPMYTIKVYLLFYFCVMVGVFVFGRIRLNLPKPMESTTHAQSKVIYALSLTIGLVAQTAAAITSSKGGDNQYGDSRSLGIVLSAALLFALVIAVDVKIRSSNGAHSFGVGVFVPWALIMFFSFLDTSRGGIISPSIVYVVTCFVRGYKFKIRHFAAALVGILLFVLYISPFEIYSRGILYGLPFKDRTYEAVYLLRTAPDRATFAIVSQLDADTGEARTEYIRHRGATLINRLAMISADSTLISACSTGFHYGWTALKVDLLHNIPRRLYKNKPEEDSAGYIGRVSGMNPDSVQNGESAISPISDSFGGFGWYGVIVLGFITFPLMVVIFESVFDFRLIWGTVALGMLLPYLGEGSMGAYIATILRTPTYVVVLSYVIGGVVRLVPSRMEQ